MKKETVETLGLVGGNLLASMLAIEAKKRGIKTFLLEPELNNIASEICDSHITASITKENIERLALKVDALVFCTSNIPVLKKDTLKTCKAYPQEEGVDLVTNRVHQLTLAELAEVPTPKYYHQNNKLKFFEQMTDVSLPFKLYQLYDDRHEVMDVYTKEDLEDFIYEIDDAATEWLIEEINDYERFLSLTVLKVEEKVYVYPVQEEVLNDEDIKYIYMPADITKSLHTKLTRFAKKLLKEIQTEGLFTFKFGVKKNRQVELININPGITVGDVGTNHYTDFSVYEQFINLIEGLPVKDGELLKPSITTVIKEGDASHRPAFPYHHYALDRHNSLPVAIYVKENTDEMK